MLICSSRRLSTRFLSACRELLVAMLHWVVPGKVLILFMDEEASNAVNRIFLVGKYPSSSYVSGPFIIFLSSLRLTERGNNFPGSPISKSNWRSNFEVSLFSGSPWLKLAFCWLWRASENDASSLSSPPKRPESTPTLNSVCWRDFVTFTWAGDVVKDSHRFSPLPHRFSTFLRFV